MFAATSLARAVPSGSRIFLALFLAIATLFASMPVKAASPASNVYILRGGFGVFSTGLDKLRKQLKDNGVNASVVSYQSWRSIARKIANNERNSGHSPVVIIGHSLGGNNAVLIADALNKKGVKVDLIVSLASTAPMTVPSNVRNVLNYYFSSGGWGGYFSPGNGFSGNLDNRDLAKSGLTHFNVDDDPGIRNQVVGATVRQMSPASAQSQ